MLRQNLKCVRGDTFYQGIRFNGLDRTLDALYFSVKAGMAKNYPILLQKSLNDGITLVEENTYLLRLSPEDTEKLGEGMFWYDFQLESEGDVATPVEGAFSVLADVTTGVLA